MATKYSFIATYVCQYATSPLSLTAARTKQFKDKFKAWGWRKNLPVAIAHFIVATTTKRERSRDVETEFEYGGRIWGSERAAITAKRARKEQGEQFGKFIGLNHPIRYLDNADMVTPNEVVYRTPVSVNHPSPGGPTLIDKYKSFKSIVLLAPSQTIHSPSDHRVTILAL